MLWLHIGVWDRVLVWDVRHCRRDAVDVLVGHMVVFGVLLLWLRWGLLNVLTMPHILLHRLDGMCGMHRLHALYLGVVYVALIDRGVELPLERPKLVDEARMDDRAVRCIERGEYIRGGRLGTPCIGACLGTLR